MFTKSASVRYSPPIATRSWRFHASVSAAITPAMVARSGRGGGRVSRSSVSARVVVPVEVEVRDSLEKAMKILKQKMSKEGILQELKRRRFYEKPSVKRKRKTREARKRLRREMKRRVVPAAPR